MADPDRTAAQAMGKYGEGIPGRAYPERAEVRLAESGDWALVIVAEDADTAEGIAASVVSSETDPFGCAAEGRPPLSLGTASVVSALDADAPVTLCHYDGVGGLLGSEHLAGEDARALVTALRATEVDPEAAGDCSAPGVDPWILVQAGGGRLWASLEGNGCLGVGITDGPDPRRFTEDALYWLMSPGVGHQWSQSHRVPAPRLLRH